ncbi:DUF6477 family protein [Limimaricola sp.]|uniref:DUF6477 family protein n=1 Tax=Limimaricola sp. TaxID=2211665 RepID=UPI0040580CF5
MQDPLSRIAALKRPQLLVDAARFGVELYDRSTALPRLIGPAARGPAQAAMALLEREGDIEARRRAGAAEYRPARHVEIMVALMGEARLLRRGGVS